MTMLTIEAPNQLLLSKRCEFSFSGEHVWLPMQNCGVKALADTLDAMPKVDIVVKCRLSSDEKRHPREIATYTKRMRDLPPWYTFSGFRPQVIDGHEFPTVLVGRLQRMV